MKFFLSGALRPGTLLAARASLLRPSLRPVGAADSRSGRGAAHSDPPQAAELHRGHLSHPHRRERDVSPRQVAPRRAQGRRIKVTNDEGTNRLAFRVGNRASVDRRTHRGPRLGQKQRKTPLAAAVLAPGRWRAFHSSFAIRPSHASAPRRADPLHATRDAWSAALMACRRCFRRTCGSSPAPPGRGRWLPPWPRVRCKSRRTNPDSSIHATAGIHSGFSLGVALFARLIECMPREIRCLRGICVFHPVRSVEQFGHRPRRDRRGDRRVFSAKSPRSRHAGTPIKKKDHQHGPPHDRCVRGRAVSLPETRCRSGCATRRSTLKIRKPVSPEAKRVFLVGGNSCGMPGGIADGRSQRRRPVCMQIPARGKICQNKFARRSHLPGGSRNRGRREENGCLTDRLRHILAPSTASWCNGSTSDSESLCQGSSPCEAATFRRPTVSLHDGRAESGCGIDPATRHLE